MWFLALLVFVLAALLLVLAVYSAQYFQHIGRAYPARGGFVSAAGARLHYVEMGPADPQGAPIVLVHGASGNLGDMVASIMPALAKHHRVIAFDRPGHGWSERPKHFDIANPAVQAEILHAAVVALGIEKPVLLGHSWGGALVTAYALAFPDEISGLVVLSGATHVWEGKTAWYHRLVSKPVIGSVFLRTLMVPGGKLLMGAGVDGNFAPDKAPAGYAASIGLPLLFRPDNFRANSMDSSRLRDYLLTQSKRYHDIKVPTIIITGNRDRTVWAKLHSYALHDEIAGSELIKLVGVGHMPHYARPDIVIDALERLANGKVPRPGTHVVEPDASLILF